MRIKEFVQKHKIISCLLLGQIFVLAVLTFKLWNAKTNIEVVSPPISFWDSRMIIFDEENNEWFVSGQFYKDSGYTVNEDTETVFGPFITLPKGDYTVAIDYRADANQVFKMYAFEQEDKIHCWDSEEIMDYHSNRVVKHYTLSDDVENLEVRICFNGQGDLHITNISIFKSWVGSLISLLMRGVLFLLTDVMILLFLRDKEIACDNPRRQAIILTVISIIALNVNQNEIVAYDVQNRILQIFDGHSIISVILFVPIVLFYEQALKATRKFLSDMRGKVVCMIPAMLFSFFIVVGHSFAQIDSWNLVFGDCYYLGRSYILFIGLSCLFYYSIAWLFALLSKCSMQKISDKKYPKVLEWYFDKLNRKPFLTVFISLMICYIPWGILAYPGIATGDTINIILQAFNVPTANVEDIVLISDNVLLNQCHPVPHTLLFHWCILFGAKVFGSANLGVFIFCLMQTVLTAVGIALLIEYLSKENVKQEILLAIEVYYVISPRIQNYLFLITKDVIYSAVVLIATITLWKILSRKQRNKWTNPTLLACFVLITFFHNTGIYVVTIILFVLVFCIKIDRKTWIITGMTIISIYICVTRIIYPLNDISPAPANGGLSIPIQQTARYINEYPNDVTESERQIINSVWSYDAIAENYDPNRADGTNGKFNKYASKDDIMAYFGVWARMLVRHPDVYVQATMNNYYEYFYPGKELASYYEYNHSPGTWKFCTYSLEQQGIDDVKFSWPMRIDKVRQSVESIRETLFGLPLLSIFLSVASYTWIMILWLMYLIYKKDGKGLFMLLPVILAILVCLVASTNGNYFRYFYQIVVILPAAILLPAQAIMSRTDEEQEENK